MAKNQTAHSGHLQLVEETPIHEATSRLRSASSALDGFTNLLFCFDGSIVLNAAELANLIEPVRSEVASALDALKAVKDGVE